MSTHNICFYGVLRKILCGYPLLSKATSHVLFKEKCIDYIEKMTTNVLFGDISKNRLIMNLKLSYHELSYKMVHVYYLSVSSKHAKLSD